MTSLEVGVSMSGQRHSCPGSECVSRERVEKGYPTSSLPPTRAATDNTLLSGMGGDNGPKEEPWGAGQERDGQRALFTTSATSSSALSPQGPQELGGTRHLRSGPSSAHGLAVCQRHLPEPLVSLPARSHSGKFLLLSVKPAPPPRRPP